MTDTKVSSTEPMSFDKVTLIYIRILRIATIIPFDGHDYNFFVSQALTVLFMSANICIVVIFAWNLIQKTSADDLLELMVVSCTTLRYTGLLYLRKDFNEILSNCRYLWNQCTVSNQLIIIGFEHRIRIILKFLCCSIFTIITMYVLTAISITLSSHEINGTGRTFLLPFKWFVDDPTDTWSGYAVIYIIQMVLMFSSGFILATVDTFLPFLMMMACGYFKVLQTRLIALSDDFTDDSIDQELSFCAKFHQDILNYTNKLRKASRNIYFIQLLCTGYNISLIGLKLVGSDPDKAKYAPLLTLSLGQLFICHWAPENLTIESESVVTAAYSSFLVCLEHGIGKNLMIMIARAQNPVLIIVAGVVNLSLENFRSLVTSALSFFTVLRSFSV